LVVYKDIPNMHGALPSSSAYVICDTDKLHRQ